MIMVKLADGVEPIEQKLMRWMSCKDLLPNDCKRYAVRLTNGCYTTDLRTPCLEEKSDSCYAWAHKLVSYWCELPNPYFPYGNGEQCWTRYLPPTAKFPEFDEERRHFFVTLANGTVDVRIYRSKDGRFDNDDPDRDYERSVVAWMLMPIVYD